jgi:hypothetical protein
MASIYNDIRAALETRLSNISNIPSIAYENVPFDPVVGTSYVQSKFVPTLRRSAVMGSPNPQQRYQGLYAVTPHTPEKLGPSVADDTDISFTNSSNETIIVSIDYAERQQGFLDSPWYYVPINIGWYIYK